MDSIKERMIRDLKRDPRKTGFMVLLAVVLVVAWIWAIGTTGESKLKKTEPPEETSTPNTDPPPNTGVKEGHTGLASIPFILTQVLPFEKVGRDPFKSPLSPEHDPGGEGGGRNPREIGKTMEQLEKEKLEGFKVSCTIMGRDGAFAMVDDEVLREGDTYKDFVLKEIGQGYVIFSGKAITLRLEVK